MHDNAKKILLDLHATDMIEIDYGFTYNHVNPSQLAIDFRDGINRGEDPSTLKGGGAAMYLYGMRLGNMDEWMMSVGDSVDSINELLTCKQVVDELGDAVLAMQAKLA